MSHYGEIERLALDNFGYFTSSAAREVGVLSCELDRWVKMGRIESSARGVYRLSNYPPTPQDAYMAGVLSVGPNAYVYGASVLALLNLVPTDPTRLFIATTRRSRRKLASSLVVVPGGRDDRISNYGGVPAQTLEDAIRVSRGYVRHDQRLRAVKEGVRQGYLMKSVGQKLVRELKHEATSKLIDAIDKSKSKPAKKKGGAK